MENKPFKFVRSPLPYVGGKFRLLPKLFEWFDKVEFETFIEPFFGGGSVGLNVLRFLESKNVLRKSPGTILYANDLDPYLVNFWGYAFHAREELLGQLKAWQSLSEEEVGLGFQQFYKAPKDEIDPLTGVETDSAKMKLVRAANLWLSAKIGWGSKIYGTSADLSTWRKGENKFLKADLAKCFKPLEELSAAKSPEREAKGIKSTQVKVYNLGWADFLQQVLPLTKNSSTLIYFDPPYLLPGAYYGTKTRSNKFDHLELRRGCDSLTEKGFKFVLSYNWCDEVQSLFNGYHLNVVDHSRGLGNSKDVKRKLLGLEVKERTEAEAENFKKEVIITNF